MIRPPWAAIGAAVIAGDGAGIVPPTGGRFETATAGLTGHGDVGTGGFGGGNGLFGKLAGGAVAIDPDCIIVHGDVAEPEAVRTTGSAVRTLVTPPPTVKTSPATLLELAAAVGMANGNAGLDVI